MNRVAFYTLGCKVNLVETEAMTELFQKKGYEIVNFEEKAEMYIINTCTVTNMSDRKSRQIIRRAKKHNKNSIVAVVGCYAQIAPEEVAKIEDVDLIIGTSDRNKIVELCEKIKKEHIKINAVKDIMKIEEFEEMMIEEIKGKTRAFIKIQEGCNQYCSYCIIPYTRGHIRSRKIEDILNEVKRLVEHGFKEIVLTGIHIASYGKDIGDIRLVDVIEKIHEVNGIERIRLSSIEPTYVTEDFMKRVSKLPKMCDHFHLSLQSGSDTVLKRMNRKYTTDEFEKNAEIIRKYMPNVGLTTDIIVGFPGETEEEFIETYKFIEKIEFSRIHVFKYSPRTGTPAAGYEKQIDGNIKTDRSKRLIALGDKLTKRNNEKYIGKKLKVLFEDEANINNECIEGHTTNYMKVLSKGDKKLEGEILPVIIEKSQKGNLIGKITKKEM